MKKHWQFSSFNTPGLYLQVLSISLLIGLSGGCTEKKKVDIAEVKPVMSDQLNPIVDTEKMPDFPNEQPADNSKYYKDSIFIEFFTKPITPPPFDFTVDCSNKSLAELRCLRNEIYARHGHLFKDAVLRGHFDQYRWYQPIFWDKTFTITLTQKEQWFIDKISRLEKKHLARNYLKTGDAIVANLDNIVNTIQFQNIPDTLMRAFSKNGFGIVATKHEQLFHVYDKNVYDCIPPYITTDLFLQLLHMHYSNLMKKLETTMLYAKYEKILKSNRDYSLQIVNQYSNNELLSVAGGFAATYFAIAHHLFTGESQSVPEDYRTMYNTELRKIDSHSDMGSLFLDYALFDYTQLVPRGHYTHTDELTRYFKGVKWLLTAPFIISTDQGLSAAIVAAYTLRNSGIQEYTEIESLLNFLTGKPDNLSLYDLVNLLESDYQNSDMLSLITPLRLKEIRTKLLSKEYEKISTCAVSKVADEELMKKRLYFMSSRYTFDAEILQRLVHCLAPEPKRPFPKGLDVYAVLKNKKAESILLKEYKDQNAWLQYKDTLSVLQNQFSTFNGWNENAYNQRMAVFTSLFHKEKSYPYFMHLDAWNTRTLITALAGWTQLKHEVVLYAKQPTAAQCGEGGIPPPMLVAYVEPNIDFWKKVNELIEASSKTLSSLKMETAEIAFIHKEISELASFLLTISEKELTRKAITEEEYDKMAYIGGQIESITLTIMDTDHFERDDPERQIGIITDVFTNNQTCLQEAVGYGNEIYVVVEINGLLYLTRGAVLSYYEFKHPSADRMTDKKWQDMLEKDEQPEMPSWIQPVFVPIQPLRSKPAYSYLFPGGC